MRWRGVGVADGAKQALVNAAPWRRRRATAEVEVGCSVQPRVNWARPLWPARSTT